MTLFAEFEEFSYSDALPYEEGVTRRDPSPVIEVDGVYYVWYSRTEVTTSGYTASIWYATSPGGYVWEEQGEALPKGLVGTFDEHAVFTPTILMAEGKFFMFYTAVPEPFFNEPPEITKTAIGVATADDPRGPWIRFEDNPVLGTSNNPREFDSLRVDDSCLVRRNGEYWMYYKGRQKGHSPAETKMGVAIAQSPTGPYQKYQGNPVLDSGHEVCVWPHGEGVGCLVCNVGPQGNTLQYSDDGIHFRRITETVPPQAPGPFRADRFDGGPGPGITWGISMQAHGTQWPYLLRFECNLNT